MDDRSLIFLQVMIALAAVGVIAFAVFLVSQYAARNRPATVNGTGALYTPQWYEYILAAAVLVIIVALAVWQFWPDPETAFTGDDWRIGNQAPIFLAVMAILAALGLVVFVIFAFVRGNTARPAPIAAAAATAATEPVAQQAHATPAASRLLGLLLPAVALLLICWVYLSLPQQHGLMSFLIYPGAFAVALVMLFDKATRNWSAKTPAESVREWILCDALVIFLVLGFLNLTSATSESYAALFWDFLFVVLFLLVFWILDRKETRLRFLVAYGFIILIPILLWIWRVVLAAPDAEAETEVVSWWSGIWPFFIVGIIFFVLEIISLIATRESNNHTVPAVKDGLFVVVYAILLLIALPEAA